MVKLNRKMNDCMSKDVLDKVLYIPLEIFSRELGGGILLANTALNRGWKVIIGGKKSFFDNLYRFNPNRGIFFLKSIVPGEVFIQDRLKNCGHRIVSLDVEGLVRTPGSAGVKLRYSNESIERTDLIFFWGKEHFNAVQNIFPRVSKKSYISGSPIFDEVLLNRELRIQERKNFNFPKKILIATSNGFSNNINGTAFAIKMAENAHNNSINAEEKSILDKKVELDFIIFEFWQSIIPKISKKFSDYEIVLRPHLTENFDFWIRFIEPFNNIRIDTNASILCELRSAEVFLHFNSTASISARLIGVPSIMICPEGLSTEHRERITFVKEFSSVISKPEDLELLLGSTNVSKKSEKDLGYYCHNANLKSKYSSDLILDKLEAQFSFSDNQNLKILPKSIIKIVRFNIREIVHFIKWISGLLISLCAPNSTILNFLPAKNSYKSSKAKQPKLELKELKAKAKSLLSVKDFNNLFIEQIDTNLFKFSRNEK